MFGEEVLEAMAAAAPVPAAITPAGIRDPAHRRRKHAGNVGLFRLSVTRVTLRVEGQLACEQPRIRIHPMYTKTPSVAGRGFARVDAAQLDSGDVVSPTTSSTTGLKLNSTRMSEGRSCSGFAARSSLRRWTM